MKTLRAINEIILLAGIDIKKLLTFLKGLPFYFRSLGQMKKQLRNSKALFPFGRAYPCLEDRFAASGTTKGHYFHQDLLIARKICLSNPKRHLDIGSRLDGFVAHVAAFRVIEVMDIRPLLNTIPNVRFVQADLMSQLPDDLIDSYDSISSLHAIEHFGLGRYGDKIDPDGYLLGLNNIYRILKKEGKFYFSVPIGRQRMEFNAHRVFSIKYLLGILTSKYQIDSFSFIDDQGDLHENVVLREKNIIDNCGCNWGCGILELTKL
jgi:SAM-dependent methyltransferase